MKKLILPPILLILTTILFYFPVVQNDQFHIDDSMHFTRHTEMQRTTWEHFASFWTTPRNNAYTPITYSLWFLQAHFSRKHSESASVYGPSKEIAYFAPEVFRVGNLISYVLCALFVYLLLLELFPNRLAAFLGSLLFALHPLHVEPVAWITGFRDTLAAFFSIASLWSYLRYCKTQARPHYYGFLGLFILGILSKPSAHVVPFLAIVFAIYFRRKPWPILKELTPLVLIAIPTFLVQSSENAIIVHVAVKETSLFSRVLISLDTVYFYLSKLVAPVNLSFDYGRSPQFFLELGGPYVTPLISVLVAVAIFCCRRWKFGQALSLGGLVFLAALLPTLGLLPFIFQHISTVGDRYVLIALLGPAIALTGFFATLKRETLQHATYFTVPVLIVLGFLSLKQIRTWKTPYTLYHQMTKVNSRSWVGYNNVAERYFITGNLRRAAYYFGKAREHGQFAEIFVHEGAMLLLLNEPNQAVWSFREATRIEPRSPRFFHNLGVALTATGDRNAGAKAFKRALKLDPQFKESQIHLAMLKEGGPFHGKIVGR